MIARVNEMLNEAICRHPDKPSIIDQTHCVTYREFYEKMLEIADQILRKGITGCPIIIALPRSAFVFEVMFAVAYSSNYWIWMDRTFPVERQREIIDQFEEVFVISDRKLQVEVDEKNYILLDPSECKTTGISFSKAPESVTKEHKLALLFTSGTTGTSKGVILTHAGMLNHTISQYKAIGRYFSDVVSFFSSYSICTISYFFSTIYAGGTFYVLPEDCFYKPTLIKEMICNNQIKTILAPPSSIDILVQYGILGELTPIETVLLAGSKVSINLVRKICSALPQAVLMSEYGATEVHGALFNYVINQNSADEIYLGNPYPSVDYKVVDDEGRPVTDGKGELWILGDFIAEGYLNRKEETELTFGDDDESKKRIYKTGDIVNVSEKGMAFIGRKDNRIKNMDYRIELDDIDRNVETIDGVKNAVSVYDSDAEEIVLFYNGSLSKAELVKKVVKVLPVYMRPGRYIYVDQIKHNQNGKIDRNGMLELSKANG